jgi:NCS2 family nucleobase:cation symporter-2
MTRKPATLQYGVADIPPPPVIFVAALQFVAVLAGFLVYPLIMAREAHAAPAIADSVLSWSMIVLAIGTSLQALPKGIVGSGYLAPSTMTAVYVSPSLSAVRLGGLPLMAGMTLFGGLLEALISRSMHRLRSLLPPELAGVVIVLVAIGNAMLGFQYLLLPGAAGQASLSHWLVAFITLAITIGLSVWGRGIMRASCVLVGMLVGYAAAIPAGLLHQSDFAELASLPLVQSPRVDYFGWSFDTVLVAPFVVAALANTLKAVALLTAAERQIDADWVRPNMDRIGAGVLADGIATTLSGVCCVFGVNVSSSAVGLNEATGVASRVVAFAISAIFVLMAFIPGLARCFTLMPAAVVGATFVFTSCAILKGGIETIASRMLDARRTLVVGLALLTGLAVEAFPGFFQAITPSLRPVLGSPLVLGTLVGFGLNAVFRLGARRRAVLTIVPEQIDFDAIHGFVEELGGRWGARRDVVTRASFAAQQLVEVIAETCEPRGAIALSGDFDEFNLAIEARYAGHRLELPERRPSEDAIRESEDGARLLAGFLLRHNADRASVIQRGENCIVRFQFHH